MKGVKQRERSSLFGELFAPFRNARHPQHRDCYGLTDCRTASAVKKACYIAALTSATPVLIRYGEMATIEVLPTATAPSVVYIWMYATRRLNAAFPSRAWELTWFFERSRRQLRAIRRLRLPRPILLHRTSRGRDASRLADTSHKRD